jgi:CMP-N,N'-diacetyllegionaminic acid synthase
MDSSPHTFDRQVEKQMKSISIIPARSGSKGIPGKNIVKLLGHPLIAYSIAASLASQSISRTIVSTDSEEISKIARFYGAEVPFLRPVEFSTDKSTDREFLIHAVDWLAEHEDFHPEYIAHLRPTSPLREPRLIDDAIHLLQQNCSATSLRSAHVASKTPYKWFEMDTNGYLRGIRPNDLRHEYYNLPRQCFPTVYDPNGYVDVIRVSQLSGTDSVHGDAIIGFITPYCHELDVPEDLHYMNYLAQLNGSPLLGFLNEKLGIESKENML